MDAEARDRAVFDLLEGSRMSSADAERRAERARDVARWRELAPALTIGGAAPTVATSSGVLPLADAELRAAGAQLREDGYFQTPPLVGGAALASLNAAVDAIVADGWPPVFAWVYDELWHCARVPAVRALVGAALGGEHAQIPHIWVHVVPAAAGAAGWRPHFDGFGARRASVWLALTDATLDNGCIHLVPRRSLPAIFRQSGVDRGAVPVADALRALKATRALPAPAGSALVWTFDVLHWGGPCVRPGAPRRAISMEFLAAWEAPDEDEMPLVPVAGPLPPFADRLRMIGQAIRTYEKFEPGLARYRPLAETLAS